MSHPGREQETFGLENNFEENFKVTTHSSPETERRVQEITNKLVHWFKDNKTDFNTAISAMSTLMGHILTHMPLKDEEIREMLKQIEDKIFNNVLELRGSRK